MSDTFCVIPGCEALLAAHGLCTLESVFAWDRGERLDKAGLESWRQRWRITLPDGDGVEHRFYLKRFDRPPLRRQIERWRRGCWGSTARIEWTNARLLAAAGIPAARPVAFGQRMIGTWECRSFVLLEELPGQSLERWVPADLPPASRETDLPRRRRRLDRLAHLVATLHRNGFVHRDLYLSHVFLQSAAANAGSRGGDEAERFALIDLQRVFRPRWRRRRWVVKDLAALNFSTPANRVGQQERLRFLCRYVRACGCFGSARQLARLVDAKTARIARRASLRQNRLPKAES